jgi:hypothetical protein
MAGHALTEQNRFTSESQHARRGEFGCGLVIQAFTVDAKIVYGFSADEPATIRVLLPTHLARLMSCSAISRNAASGSRRTVARAGSDDARRNELEV